MKIVKGSGSKDPNDIDKAIGAKILQLRLSLGLTRQDMAHHIGVTHQQLQKYEKGTNRISASRLVAVAEVLGVSAEYFYEDFSSALSLAHMEKQRSCIELMRDFLNIRNKSQQDALKRLVRVLADN